MIIDDQAVDTPIDWRNCAVGLCDAPLEEVDRDRFDSGHPALAFEFLWKKLAKGDEVPRRDDFRPTMARSLLKWVIVFDRENHDGQLRFNFRLIGTAAEVLVHQNFTGQYLDEITTGACVETRVSIFEKAFSSKKPLFGSARLGKQSEFKTSVLLGIFPFAGDETKPDEVFVVVAPAQIAQRAFL